VGHVDVEWHDLERAGRVVGRYQVYRSDPPTADLFEAVGSVEDAVEAVVDQLGGWLVATADEELADSLILRGAEQTRHSHVMSKALPTVEDMPAWTLEWELEPIDATTRFGDEVVPLIRRAYPPGHPDEEEGTDQDIVDDIHARLRGDRLGPHMPGSAVVRDEGRPVGLIIVNRVPGEPPFAGPWISDVCRDPDPRYRGVGRALLEYTIRCIQEAGEAGLSLAVTVGNPAQRVYERLGFRIATTSRKVRIPG
jgi:ribosomal protein S18 acetylase RimI-like enzyme